LVVTGCRMLIRLRQAQIFRDLAATSLLDQEAVIRCWHMSLVRMFGLEQVFGGLGIRRERGLVMLLVEQL
jgi:hypothetical protein